MVKMKKRILFICKNNVFRSQIAKQIFNKLNKNKEYIADSAGLIKWKESELIGDNDCALQKNITKKLGMTIGKGSKSLSREILSRTDILVIVADDVPREIFKDRKAFKGKLIVWNIRDLQADDENKEKVIHNLINIIEEKVKSLIKNLK
jgi:protein-tyrosine-phosphatase